VVGSRVLGGGGVLGVRLLWRMFWRIGRRYSGWLCSRDGAFVVGIGIRLLPERLLLDRISSTVCLGKRILDTRCCGNRFWSWQSSLPHLKTTWHIYVYIYEFLASLTSSLDIWEGKENKWMFEIDRDCVLWIFIRPRAVTLRTCSQLSQNKCWNVPKSPVYCQLLS